VGAAVVRVGSVAYRFLNTSHPWSCTVYLSCVQVNSCLSAYTTHELLECPKSLSGREVRFIDNSPCNRQIFLSGETCDACTANPGVFFFNRPTGRPKRTSLPQECHRKQLGQVLFSPRGPEFNEQSRTRGGKSGGMADQPQYRLLWHSVCLLLQDLVQSCLHGRGGDMGVAPPMHAPSRAPLLLPILLSHNIPFPRVH
jgi:hypothetical protein